MSNDSLDYKLGQIDAKLEANEEAHKQILGGIKEIKDTLTNYCNTTNTRVVTLETQVAATKAMAKGWAMVISGIFAILAIVAQWVWSHIAR